MMLARNERIVVQAGDIYGIHYPNSTAPGIVPYDESGNDLCCGVSLSDLSRVYNGGIYDSDLPVGRVLTISFHSTMARLPALRPIGQGERM